MHKVEVEVEVEQWIKISLNLLCKTGKRFHICNGGVKVEMHMSPSAITDLLHDTANFTLGFSPDFPLWCVVLLAAIEDDT